MSEDYDSLWAKYMQEVELSTAAIENLHRLALELAKFRRATDITAGDVRAAEQAWNEDRYARGWPFHADLPMVRAAFIADHLNRRTTAPSTPTPVAGTSDAENEKENEG